MRIEVRISKKSRFAKLVFQIKDGIAHLELLRPIVARLSGDLI